MNTTEITIDGTVYNVNLEEAKKLGLIKKKVIKRPVRVADITNGTLFKWNNRSATTILYMMIDNKKRQDGQCFRVGSNDSYLPAGHPASLMFDTEVSYFDIPSLTWISEIED